MKRYVKEYANDVVRMINEAGNHSEISKQTMINRISEHVTGYRRGILSGVEAVRGITESWILFVAMP